VTFIVLLAWECGIKGRAKIPEDELISGIQEWLLYGPAFAEFMHTDITYSAAAWSP